MVRMIRVNMFAILATAATVSLGTTLGGCASMSEPSPRGTFMQRCLEAAQTQADKNECHWANARPKGGR